MKNKISNCPELMEAIQQIGLVPLLDSDIPGFSADELVTPECRYVRRDDGSWDWPLWDWKGPIVTEGHLAYGKFFGNKAGFISLEWLPYFANCRRNGYDFDSRYQDGLATRREKKIMDFFIGEDEDGDAVFKDVRILSTDLKKAAEFGKGGDKNFPGVITGLQMQTYLVISDFQRRRNKRGEEYGMPVSIMLTLVMNFVFGGILVKKQSSVIG